MSINKYIIGGHITHIANKIIHVHVKMTRIPPITLQSKYKQNKRSHIFIYKESSPYKGSKYKAFSPIWIKHISGTYKMIRSPQFRSVIHVNLPGHAYSQKTSLDLSSDYANKCFIACTFPGA